MIVRRTAVVRQSSGFRRTASARTRPFAAAHSGGMDSWEFGRTVRRWRDRVGAVRGRRPGRRTPSRGRAAPRRTGRAGRDLGRLPDPARARAGHLTVGAGRGGARPRVAGLRRRARPALPAGRARHPGTRRRLVAHHAERATPARSPGAHTRRRLRRDLDSHRRQRAVRRADGSDDKLAGNRTQQRLATPCRPGQSRRSHPGGAGRIRGSIGGRPASDRRSLSRRSAVEAA